MRMIAGFDEPTEGHVLPAGKTSPGCREQARREHGCSRTYALFPHMTGPRTWRSPQAQRRRQGPRWPAGSARCSRSSTCPAGRSAGPRSSPAASSSGGAGPRAGQQAARPAAREPLAALDLKLRQAMQVELKRIQREVGITSSSSPTTRARHSPCRTGSRLMSNGVRRAARTAREIYEPTRATRGSSPGLHRHARTCSRGHGARVSGAGRDRGGPESGSSSRCPVPAPPGRGAGVTVRPEKDVHLRAAAQCSDCAVRASSPRSSTSASPPTTTCGPRPGRTSRYSPERHVGGRRGRPGDSVWLSWSRATPTRSEHEHGPEDRPRPAAPASPNAGTTVATVMRMFGVGAGLGAAGLALAACGVKGAKQAPATQDDVASSGPARPRTGTWTSPTWALYMPPTHAPRPPSPRRPASRSTTRRSSRTIRPGTARSSRSWPPTKPIGYDLMVVTNGVELSKLKSSVTCPTRPLEAAQLRPDADPIYKNEPFDKGNVYTIPYTSGTPESPTTHVRQGTDHQVAQLWDLKYAGKIGMMKDPQELGNFGMPRAGHQPGDLDPAGLDEGAASCANRSPWSRAYRPAGLHKVPRQR